MTENLKLTFANQLNKLSRRALGLRDQDLRRYDHEEMCSLEAPRAQEVPSRARILRLEPGIWIVFGEACV